MNGEIKKVLQEQKQSSKNLLVYEATYKDTITVLLEENLPRLLPKEDKSPVVIVDYLQIIPHDNDSAKRGIDLMLPRFKTFQRETNTTFIVISSLNRQSYNTDTSFEAFKETGSIEYSSDVVWALQLSILDGKHGNEAKKKELDKAIQASPRNITLKCLKNRNGGCYRAYFKYYSKFDLFEVDNNKSDTSQPIKSNADAELEAEIKKLMKDHKKSKK